MVAADCVWSELHGKEAKYMKKKCAVDFLKGCLSKFKFAYKASDRCTYERVSIHLISDFLLIETSTSREEKRG